MFTGMIADAMMTANVQGNIPKASSDLRTLGY